MTVFAGMSSHLLVLLVALSGPLRFRVQSRSRTRVRIAASIVFLFRVLFKGYFFYAEQMDAEGLGRKLLLPPSGDPRRALEKQTMGTATASHKMLTQSVPQNGRVHLHINRDDLI